MIFNKENDKLKKLKKRIEKSNLFDKVYYLKENSDARLSDLLPIDHYIIHGINENRKPNKEFDPIWYLSQYNDVKENDIDPLSHYILFGEKENRAINEENFLKIENDKKNNLTEKSNLFKHIDQESYLKANIDIFENIKKNVFSDASEHFIKFGFDEIKNGKRRIGLEFPYYNEEEYLNINSDIKCALENNSIKSAFTHFLEYGQKEFLAKKREIGGYYPFLLSNEMKKSLETIFEEDTYLETNPDVKEAILKKSFKNAFEHFINFGIQEIRFGKRQIHKDIPLMSETKYILTYEDIFNACKEGIITSPYEHFLFNGIKEVLNGQRVLPNDNSYKFKEEILTDDIILEIKNFELKPLISVVMPVYNVDSKWIDLAIKSLENQWYKNWEICIADDKSTKEGTINYLKSIDNEKIKIKFLEKNLNISGASNEALSLTSGEYILLMDNDDELTPDALYEVVKAINYSNAEFIYSDEDKLEMNGEYSDPHFKPDYAPDMFLSQNYISHLGVIKKDLLLQVGGWELGLEGSQDFDLYLKVLEKTDKIVHIPKVLYHWRKIPGSTAAEYSDKSYAQNAGKKALENAMKRRNIDAVIENGKYPGTYRIKYEIKGNPLISIIIPFKDKPELLKMCVESILNRSTYNNFEIIGISNNSEEKDTFDEMTRLKNLDSRVSFYEYNVPFNYSDINNYAVNTYAKGEHIILLNNDIEIITPSWIEEMLMFSQQEDIGVVGAKLYYPNDTIQHAGVSIGVLTLAGHNFRHHPRNSPAYMGRESVIQNISAVTAACLMIKKSIYNEVNGLNENDLTVAFNDIDFCLRVQENGYKNIYTPYCEAYHYESVSRGAEDNPEKIKRFNSEVSYMLERHKNILKNGDPYYNINLTLEKENFGLRE